jgi:hypothetical protein
MAQHNVVCHTETLNISFIKTKKRWEGIECWGESYWLYWLGVGTCWRLGLAEQSSRFTLHTHTTSFQCGNWGNIWLRPGSDFNLYSPTQEGSQKCVRFQMCCHYAFNHLQAQPKSNGKTMSEFWFSCHLNVFVITVLTNI